MESCTPLLRLQGITKRFGAMVANEAIDLDLASGEIVALLGENGAGKTTLMNILFGHYVADEGHIRLADSAGSLAVLPPGSPQAALAAGIGMVHQHFTLAHNLTGLENIMLGTEPAFSFGLPKKRALERLKRLIAETGLTVDLNIRIERLSVGERQRIEILKALYRDVRVLVLDEPTAVLTPQDAEKLFSAIRILARRGLAVIFISHKFNEVLALAHRIVVLRQGRKVADLSATGADRETLARHMIGKPLERSRPTVAKPRDAVLALAQVSCGEGRDRLVEADLTVHGGEIVGIAGVSGNGQRGLADLVSGLQQVQSGDVSILGAPPGKTPREIIARGVGRLTEDRHQDGIVSDLTVAENLILERTRAPSVQKAGFLRPQAVQAEAKEAIRAFDVRGPGPDAPIRLLSGGNIQKLLLARALHGEPRLILANQPTRGLDIGAADEVHRRLRVAAENGAGILLISEDLDELRTLAHRIAVIHAGHLTPAVETDSVDIDAIGLAMAGQPAGPFLKRTPAQSEQQQAVAS